LLPRRLLQALAWVFDNARVAGAVQHVARRSEKLHEHLEHTHLVT
jgi:hypothetical protein